MTGWAHGVRDASGVSVARSTLYAIVQDLDLHDPVLARCVAATRDSRFSAPIADSTDGGWWLYRHLA
jgi:hypothetical protein